MKSALNGVMAMLHSLTAVMVKLCPERVAMLSAAQGEMVTCAVQTEGVVICRC